VSGGEIHHFRSAQPDIEHFDTGLYESIGDGVVFVNDRLTRLGPFADNAPPYPAYALTAADGDGPRFQIERIAPTSEVRSLLIGTDGVNDLIAAQDRPVPGKTETVGPISRFWKDECYFANPDAVRRRLALINSECVRQDPQTPLHHAGSVAGGRPHPHRA